MKGIATWAIALVAVVVIGAFLIGAPQIVFGWANQLLGIQPNCNNDPYNGNCLCDTGQRRVSVPWVGIPRWHCETIELLIIDPESPNFETEAIDFAQTYLEFHCGNTCTDLSCGGNICGCPPENPNCGVFGATHPSNEANNPCISAIFGYGSTGARIVNMECVRVDEWADAAQTRPKTGSITWRMNFFVEGATDNPSAYEFFSNYCFNPPTTEKCEPPMNIVPSPFSILPLNIVSSSFPPPG